ncbi:hypothetical protein LEMLEM_LOCUS10268, partial [Lemmus lemmus]
MGRLNLNLVAAPMCSGIGWTHTGKIKRKVGNKRIVANCQMLIKHLCMENMLPGQESTWSPVGSRYF